MSGFSFVPMGDGTDITVKQPLAPSQTVAKGDALIRTNGLLYVASSATGLVNAIAKEAITSASTESPDIKVTLVKGKIFSVPISVFVDDITCDSNSTANLAVATSATFSGVANDAFNGGVLYSKELDEQAVIIDSATSTNTVTFTLAKDMSEALSTSHTIRVCLFGINDTTVQLGSTPKNSLSQSVAGLSSGKVSIHKVDLKARIAFVSFNES